jgi:regulator of protease activity HflC (stomatin/prohibitin superfamily)
MVPPASVKNAMEQQMTAERTRRALIAKSEADRQSRINNSEGYKMEVINKSEGEMQRRINEAEGKAQEILALAEATALAIETIAAAATEQGGADAVRLRLSQQYLTQLGYLARPETSVVLPVDLTQLNDLLRSLNLGMDTTMRQITGNE